MFSIMTYYESSAVSFKHEVVVPGLGDHAVVVAEVPADASKHHTSDDEENAEDSSVTLC